MIRTEHLSRSYGEKQALVDLNLEVEPGEILGFLGPNGAGKSTTVRILTGLIRPSSGRAIVAGFDVVEQPVEVKRRIGYVPETAALYDALTAAEYLELVACLHHMDTKTAATRRDELLELFGLGDARNQRMTEFSKGMRQKVVMVGRCCTGPRCCSSTSRSTDWMRTPRRSRRNCSSGSRARAARSSSARTSSKSSSASVRAS
jgi:ABC-2 type transport system ATP-binding protein